MLRCGVPGSHELFAKDGKYYQGTFVDGRLHGKGYSRRKDGNLEFQGTWSNGKRHTGTGYIKGNETYREDWLNGKMRGLKKVGYAFKPKRKKAPRPKPGTRQMSCPNCLSSGKVYQDAKYEWVPRRSLILAGSRHYGSRYTHLESQTHGTKVTVRPSGYVPCLRCQGTGWLRY